MKLSDVVYGPWAITPEMYQEVLGIYSRHLRGEKIDLKALEASIGSKLDNHQEPYEVIGRNAIIPIEGVIAKRMNLMTRISGGASSSFIADQFRDALENPGIDQIVLNIDSPGGTVDGTQELATLISESRGQKPIIAFTDGMIASAAYWIASAADKIFITGDTNVIGSIGVVTTHSDQSEAEKQAGIRTTVITAGKYKAMGHEHAPLDDASHAEIQSRLNTIYSAFVEDVARNRKKDIITVLSEMADGKVFLGRQAIHSGLVDGVSTLEDILLSAPQHANVFAGDGVSLTQTATIHQEAPMPQTLEQLQAESPDLVIQIRSEGATSERERIKGVLAQNFKGHEALIESLAFDGSTTPEQAAVKVLAAEKGKLAAMRHAIEDQALAPVPNAPIQAAQNANPEEDDTLPVEQRAKARWDKDPKVRAEFGTFETYRAFIEADANGQIRILGTK